MSWCVLRRTWRARFELQHLAASLVLRESGFVCAKTLASVAIAL
jgi:hypothetical protein